MNESRRPSASADGRSVCPDGCGEVHSVERRTGVCFVRLLIGGAELGGASVFAVAAAFRGWACGFNDGAHPVVAVFVDFNAVDFALEAGEAFAEGFHGDNELDDGAFGAAEALAGHRHGDAGGVRNEHDGGDASGHVGEAKLFGFAADEFLIGLSGGEDGIEILVAGFVDEAGEVEFDHGGVHLVGEFFKGDVAVAGGVFGDEFGEGLFERGFGVVESLELKEVFKEGTPFSFGGADGEEDEDGVVAGAGDLDAASVEEFGEDGGGDAPLGDDALGVDAGGEDGDLGGVQHAVAVGDVVVLVAVPLLAGFEGPAGGLVGEEAVGGFFKEVGLAVEGVEDVLGLVEAEEPSLLCGAETVGDGGHGLAEGDGVLEGLGHEGWAGGFVHHGGGYVEAGDQRVEGGGRPVHHEGFVELVEVEGRAGA